jgi:hypothetical protein
MGDYHHYLAEITTGEKWKSIINKALVAYQKALTKTDNHCPADPMQLALKLNTSVLYYELIGEKDTACNVAWEAFAEASAVHELAAQ